MSKVNKPQAESETCPPEAANVGYKLLSAPRASHPSSIGPYITWIIAHLGQLGAIIAIFKTVITAPTLAAKAKAVKDLIDALIPILSDFPTADTARSMVAVPAEKVREAEKTFNAQYSAQGIDWAMLLALIKWIINTFGKTSVTSEGW